MEIRRLQLKGFPVITDRTRAVMGAGSTLMTTPVSRQITAGRCLAVSHAL